MERVLLVDDEPQVLVALEDLLSDEFIVLKTASPKHALDLIENNSDIAVVISDERMPQLTGSELLARIRANSNARRILVTGFADLSAVIRAVNDGKIFAYVTKPWNSQDLKQKVHQAADQFRLVEEVTSEHQLLRDLMDNTPDAIFFKDRLLRIRGANQSFATLLGVSNAGDLVGKKLDEVVSSLPHLGASLREERAILVNGEPSLDVVRDYDVAGHKRWISESKAPIRGPSGEVLGIVGIARDVTERVLMGETLRESEARLSQQTRLLNTILNSMQEAVIASDRDGQFVLFNRHAQELFKKPAPGVSAFDWARSQDVYLPDRSGMLRADENPLVLAMRGERTRETEVSILDADPEAGILAITGSPLRDEQQNLVGGLALLRNVTRQRQLERQLTQAQKMEAVGRLAGGVAHDFNNLLSVIVSYTDFVQRALPEDDSKREDLSEVLAAANRAASLTRQLLAFSRQRVVHHQVLQLNDIVANLERMLRRVIGEHIELCTALSHSLAPIRADLGQMEQVLLNLTVNARDAMPAGGKLTFETANIIIEQEDSAAFERVPPGHYVMLAIKDTGTGMTEDVKKRIFEPFFTTKDVGEGTGLGLATVYGIVQQSGGHVDVESEVGQGSCFRIYLPSADSANATVTPRHSSSPPPKGTAGATILLVEDDDSVRMVSSRILRARGHTVLEAKRPSEALVQCELGTEVDLLLTDIVLPEMSGVELAQQIAKARPSLRVLFMSGYPGGALASEEHFEAKTAYIQKPFSPYSLAERIRELLESSFH